MTAVGSIAMTDERKTMRKYKSYLQKGLKMKFVLLPHTDNRCQQCGKLFIHKHNLIRHNLRMHVAEKHHSCSKCNKTFYREHNKFLHERHCNKVEYCHSNSLKRKLVRDFRRPHKRAKNSYSISITNTAFKNAVVTYTIKYHDCKTSFFQEISESIDAMSVKIIDFRKLKKALKFNMALYVVFEKSLDPEVKTDPAVCLVSEQLEVYADTNISKLLDFVKKQFIEQIDTYEQNGSGWILYELTQLQLTTWELNVLRGKGTFFPLPLWIQNKRAVVNVRNVDNKCFMWSVLAALHTPRTKRAPRNLTTYYQKYITYYNFGMLEFPVAVKDIAKFENRNNISINVYGLEEPKYGEHQDSSRDFFTKSNNGIIYPLKVCKKEIIGRHANLLITEKDGILHYSTITQFSRLVGSQYNKDDTKYFYCYSCLHGFKKKKNEQTREDCLLLVEHRKYCKTLNPQRTVFPLDNEAILKFTSIEKQLKVPFVVYADFECFLKENITPNTRQEITDKKQKEFAYQEHVPVSYSYKIVSIDPDFVHDQRLYKGPCAAEHFLDTLQAESRDIFKKYIADPKPLMLSNEDEMAFHSATKCHICERDFEKSDTRVRDHCHIIGHFRGAAHKSCNLAYKINPKTWKIPVFFHNLRGYDGHLIIHAIQRRHGRVRVIPTNIEKYMAFSVGRLQFLDTYQFMPEPLDKLVKTLDDGEFIYTRREFPDEEQFRLMKQKGVFPYDYLDDISKITSTKRVKFPSKSKFFNRLNDTAISEKDYLRGKIVFDKYCKTFGDYHDIYLKTDVLLLADFFEKFRKTCLYNYNLDMAHYYSTAGLAFSSALKMSGVELQLLQDEEMYTFFEKGIRGGISMICKRYAAANNPKCAHFDHTKPTTYLVDLDMNNLYGGAMAQTLPTHGFKFLNSEEIQKINIENHPDDAEDGFVFEVDLEYPKELHEVHNDYPLCVESLLIDETMLSPLQRKFPRQAPQIKLTPNLRDKTNYILHYRNLKYYIEMGMRVQRIHRVLMFKQRPWLKIYIDYNTKCRARSTCDFEKNFYKLMNNSVFGKCQENLRKRTRVEIISNPKVAMKRVASPAYKRSQIIRENLVIIQSAVTTLKLDKPLYVGFTVLDLSKLMMYKFHYDEMLPLYGNNIQLLLTDTDSLLYEIRTDDVYKDMKENSDLYDFSEYPHDHPNFSLKNKKIVGRMKDEARGMIIDEFIGLRPKCYSLLCRGFVRDNVIQDENIRHLSTSKGIKKGVKIAHLRHDHYKDSLFNLKTIIVKQNMIISKKHTISTYHVTKTALTAFDTKRWILQDNIHTLAHGHYKAKYN